MVSKKNTKTSGEDFDEFLLEVGNKLRSYRQKAGYTSYEQFAFDKGIGRAQYGKYEKGTEDMRLSSLFKILDALGVTWEEFFNGK
ncbi:helix-turn-helix domain-containing protein [Niabella sp. 22666]|uniref:helix-turn-helix domain-containing protein n=1 Tax=Niabella sp. 22666 TaxID=3453954 RepID=UPI003F879EA8